MWHQQKGRLMPDKFMSINSILFLHSPVQVSYHLRFSFTPRKAPFPEKSELNPNSDLDWHTLSLFPLFQMPGPREQYDKEGGTPGENLRLFLFGSPCLCLSLSVKDNSGDSLYFFLL